MTSEEIENILERLKAIENNITELNKVDLFIAKHIVSCIAPMELNIAGRTMTGEDLEIFQKSFINKIAEMNKRLEDVKTIKEVFSLGLEFDAEIADFIKATKVDNADKAMDIAHAFIKKYVPVALPLKVERQEDIWLVDIDVGALDVKVAKVKVDARTGDILSYDIPQRESKEN